MINEKPWIGGGKGAIKIKDLECGLILLFFIAA